MMLTSQYRTRSPRKGAPVTPADSLISAARSCKMRNTPMCRHLSRHLPAGSAEEVSENVRVGDWCQEGRLAEMLGLDEPDYYQLKSERDFLEAEISAPVTVADSSIGHVREGRRG